MPACRGPKGRAHGRASVISGSLFRLGLGLGLGGDLYMNDGEVFAGGRASG